MREVGFGGTACLLLLSSGRMEQTGEAQTENIIIVIPTWYGLSITQCPVTCHDGRYIRGVIVLRVRKEFSELCVAVAAGVVRFVT